jgi:hypothetical protein
MNNYYDKPDGEVFADVPTKQIASADTWENLSVNQLLEVQSELQLRMWEFRAHPLIPKALQSSLLKLQALISLRLNEG